VREALNSDAAKQAVNAWADQVAESINGEDRGEFRSGYGTHEGKTRAHAFVNTYDKHARATANKDPGIFSRHLGG
jgi:nucleoid DNA-binding protein